MFIVFEGIDGTGKSTQVQKLALALRQNGQHVITSKEPTDGPHGTRLRQSALTGRLSPAEELNLFLLDRQEHVDSLILPNLEKGHTVILDRYFFSTMAYQGSRGFDPAEIRRRNEEFAPLPHLLIILELPPALALERIGSRDGQANEFEQLEALEACHRIFASLPDPFIRRIDASLSPDQVHTRILADVSELTQGFTCHPPHQSSHSQTT